MLQASKPYAKRAQKLVKQVTNKSHAQNSHVQLGEAYYSKKIQVVSVKPNRVGKQKRHSCKVSPTKKYKKEPEQIYQEMKQRVKYSKPPSPISSLKSFQASPVKEQHFDDPPERQNSIVINELEESGLLDCLQRI